MKSHSSIVSGFNCRLYRKQGVKICEYPKQCQWFVFTGWSTDRGTDCWWVHIMCCSTFLIFSPWWLGVHSGVEPFLCANNTSKVGQKGLKDKKKGKAMAHLMDSLPHIFSLLLFTPSKGHLFSKSPVMVTRMEKTKLLYVISRAVRWVKFETILKYHECYLCQISRTNHDISCLYYYLQRVVISTCRYFKWSWNTTALSQWLKWLQLGHSIDTVHFLCFLCFV